MNLTVAPWSGHCCTLSSRGSPWLPPGNSVTANSMIPNCLGEGGECGLIFTGTLSLQARSAAGTVWSLPGAVRAAGLSWLAPVTAGCPRTLDNGLLCPAHCPQSLSGHSLPGHLWFCLPCGTQNPIPEFHLHPPVCHLV